MIENHTTTPSTSPSKLIVIEGIPGSGKTTTAHTVQQFPANFTEKAYYQGMV